MCVHHAVLGDDFLDDHTIDVRGFTITIEGPVPSANKMLSIRAAYYAHPFFMKYDFSFVEESKTDEERAVEDFAISPAGLCAVQSRVHQLIVSEFDVDDLKASQFYRLGAHHGVNYSRLREFMVEAGIKRHPEGHVIGEVGDVREFLR